MREVNRKMMVAAQARRQQVTFIRGRGLSQRRACALLSVARSTMSYSPRLPAKDAAALSVMRELAGRYPRFGYRRIQVFLRRLGHAMTLIEHIDCGARPHSRLSLRCPQQSSARRSSKRSTNPEIPRLPALRKPVR
jgi:putative transposase